MWPILINVHEERKITPMIVGIFSGKSKPTSIEEYLQQFVDEAVLVLQNGIVINGYILSVKIRAFICDSPARAFIKGKTNTKATK